MLLFQRDPKQQWVISMHRLKRKLASQCAFQVIPPTENDLYYHGMIEVHSQRSFFARHATWNSSVGTINIHPWEGIVNSILTECAESVPNGSTWQRKNSFESRITYSSEHSF